MAAMEPLLQDPAFVPTPWGGRKLQDSLGKLLPPGRIGESWEISTHPKGLSRIRCGPLAGLSLLEVIRRHPGLVLGGADQPAADGGLGLLVKFIDAAQRLSVQVHPDEAYARSRDGLPGKTEMWIVLEAAPGSRLVYGLQPGVDRRILKASVLSGRMDEVLRTVSVSSGDILFVPPGTVHAVLEGILLLEIQQSSDTTYRLYDWGRVGLDGSPRKIHLDRSLDVIRYDFRGEALKPSFQEHPAGWRAPLASCPYFSIELFRCRGSLSLFPLPDRCQLLVLTAGAGRLLFPGGELSLRRGDSLLVPAACPELAFDPDQESELVRTAAP